MVPPAAYSTSACSTTAPLGSISPTIEKADPILSLCRRDLHLWHLDLLLTAPALFWRGQFLGEISYTGSEPCTTGSLASNSGSGRKIIGLGCSTSPQSSILPICRPTDVYKHVTRCDEKVSQSHSQHRQNSSPYQLLTTSFQKACHHR